MAKRVQISVLLIAILLSEVNSVTVFQGLSIKKGIDISFIPFPVKSIVFLKAKWSPFTSFGIKHEIVRRQAINTIEPKVIVTPVPVLPPAYAVPEVPRPLLPPLAPVVEHYDVPDIPQNAIPLIKPHVTPLVKNNEPKTPPVPAVVEVQAPTILPSEQVAITQAKVPPVIITPVPPIPIQAPPLPSIVPKPLPNNLNTDISRATAINDYLNTVEKPVVPVAPPVTEVKETETPSLLSAFLPKGSVKSGSKLAIQLGSAFLHLMTQIFSSPRSPFTKLAE